MSKLLRATLTTLICSTPATAFAESHDTWPCSLVPSVCSLPPPIAPSVPWLEANAANALTAIVLTAVFMICGRRQRWESSPADRLARKRRWSAAPSYSDS